MAARLLGSLLLSAWPSFGAGCGDDSEAAGGGAGHSPEELVPPEPLGGDPASACPAQYQDTSPVEGDNQGFEAAGQSRRFYLVGPDASFTGPRPLLVAFNGTAETGKGFFDRAKLEDFAAAGFVVVAPWSAGNGTVWPVWDAQHGKGDPDANNPDLAFFDALVACLGAHRPIDKNRIFATGHSAGGTMTHYVMQRRSELLAGGIVASGTFSLTAPEPKTTLDDLFVVVTWGGDNDEPVSISMNLAEQASIASVFYDSEPNVSQANCRGNDLGHKWLPINDWFVRALLDHPKGLAQKGATTLPALGADAPATCTVEPYVFTSSLTVTCPSPSTVAGCAETCQFIGDCVVENATVNPIFALQLSELGFSGPDNTDCGGCVAHCEAVATTPADAEVLACLQDLQGVALCGPGIEGAWPFVDAINTCCDGRSDSPWCVDTCTILLANSVAGVLASCSALVN